MAETALTDDERLVLTKVPSDQAYWTSDIAWSVRHHVTTTNRARRILQKLAGLGLVVVVAPGGQGHPRSWKRSEAGDAVLAAPIPHTPA